MRIKDYRRMSAVGTAVSVLVAVLGGVCWLWNHDVSIILIILGIAGVILSSAAIRLYGKMSMDAFFRGKDPKQ